jgi:hypothetical protein
VPHGCLGEAREEALEQRMSGRGAPVRHGGVAADARACGVGGGARRRRRGGEGGQRRQRLCGLHEGRRRGGDGGGHGHACGVVVEKRKSGADLEEESRASEHREGASVRLHLACAI